MTSQPSTTSSTVPSGTVNGQNGLQNSTIHQKTAVTSSDRFKAGMGVGMTACGLILIFIGWLLYRCWKRRRESNNSPPPYKPTVIPFVPPAQDPYYDMASTNPIQTHPGPSRSGMQVVAPLDNPYQLDSPSRTTSPVSTSNNTIGGLPPRVALRRGGRGWADG